MKKYPFEVLVKNWLREASELRLAMADDGEDDFTLGHIRALEKCAECLANLLPRDTLKARDRGGADDPIF